MILDTFALLWMAFQKERLSKKAVNATSNASDLLINSISIWEIGIKIKRKRLKIPISIQNFVHRLKEIDGVKIIPVDEDIWMESLKLKWKHNDPADRVIVATARILDMPIVTDDREMRKFYKKVIW